MIAVLGAGPHGREIARLFADEGVLLCDDGLPGFPSVIRGGNEHPYLIGAAWPAVRRAIASKVGNCAAHLGGTVLFPGSRVSDEAYLGRHVHVGFNAVVSHGCTVGDFVQICPGAVLAGDVTVDDDVFVGAGAVVIHGGVKIGRGAMIGAGAVVIADVPPGVVVAGSPARVLR